MPTPSQRAAKDKADPRQDTHPTSATRAVAVALLCGEVCLRSDPQEEILQHGFGTDSFFER